jgi:hypothetical protein
MTTTATTVTTAITANTAIMLHSRIDASENEFPGNLQNACNPGFLAIDNGKVNDFDMSLCSLRRGF